ncbi:MAG: hypothetical protein GWM98_20675 [Nitrospinaceae bacterium]|nr:hypothetical protein [Nitrospinaceae bacterium]NIT83740.1 hypothetical protein [Nitrospinaceae bacterium]NIU45944.1 hypothetical protein [Nitrospinaceae bacterium]NIU98104.1 hypothetical protein [Nitrospinaceae bacterium]NIW07510.1 hypothetical protein [Nitrospinaceae bacterium]
MQRHFLRGVAALHSFWYEEARAAFRRSTQMDPGFLMGYWGEAMALNRPLWEQQDARAAREALAKVKDLTPVTARERAYLDAVKLLYGKGDKRSRDESYSRAMEKIHRDYPEDLEAACFYALSLLGAARNSEHQFRLQVRAGAISLEVFRRNPDHPCAAHYTIHAFDHPDLAILALPAALRYGRIAPASHHAQHMPAHIFVQLGMWPEAAAANEAGWQNSVDWVERERLSKGRRDYHSLQWLHYVYLQQGRYEKADEVFRLKLKDMMEAGGNSKTRNPKTHRRINKYYERMAGASVVETERWKLAATLQEPPGWDRKSHAHASLTFVRGFAAAMLNQDKAAQHLAALNAIRKEGFARNYFKRPEHLDIWELEIQAAIQSSKKNHEKAIALVRRATAIEQKLSAPSGPPKIIKPTYELLGEFLLRAGKPKEAGRQFATSLSRHPNRARSLLGAARAAADQGLKNEAVEWYSKFLAVWTQADPNLPGLLEARRYLKKENVR